MRKYSKWSPTAYDRAGAFLAEQQDWLVAEFIRTRDSGNLEESNFQSVLDSLRDAGRWELHRFPHWGPGWYEIILVRPGTPAETIVRALELKVEDYPVLDEEDLSRREYEEACESWERMPLADRVKLLARHNLSIFAARRDELPDLPYHDELIER